MSPDHAPCVRQELRWSRPTRPKFNPLVKSLDASMAADGIFSLPAKMLFGDVGVVTCLPGFTLSGGVKCGADVDFVPVGSLPACSPRSCGVPPEVSGAAEEVFFQGNVTYTCDRGYTVGGLATLTRDVTRTCFSDGFCSQTDVLCLSRPRGVPPLAHSASRSDVGVVYGQSVTYTCDPGFEETEVDGEKVCGSVDDCGGIGCRGYGTCVDLVDGYRCTVLCAEGCSTDSSTSEASSSFVVECEESGSLFNLQACQPVQCNAMPPMKYINPMIQVECLFGQNVAFELLDGYLVDGTASGDTSFSASCSSDGSWALSDCRPITCGSFSSPANDVTSPTSAFVDGVVHVSCDSGHSLTQTSYVHEIACTCTSRRPKGLKFQTHLLVIL